jgi:hypothetical protein
MSPAEIKDRTDTVNKLVAASAKRPVATRTLADSGSCTSPRCTCKQGCSR